MNSTMKLLAGLGVVMILGFVLAACRQTPEANQTQNGGSNNTAPAAGFQILPDGGQVTKLDGKPDTPATPKPTGGKPAATDNKPPVVTKRATIQTAKGNIEIELYGKDAPNTVDNFVKLAGKHFYKGLNFHRVETSPEFRLIQGGCPQGNGQGGPGYTIDLEISPKLRHEKGAVAMARANDPNSAGSQFYICINDVHQLDDQYAVFGKVTKGLDVADKIVVGDKMTDIVIH